MRIALDAMGGDFGPKNLVEGAVLALQTYQDISQLSLVGDGAEIVGPLEGLLPKWQSLFLVALFEVVIVGKGDRGQRVH
jgi:glycerol-3-phosphate acyltransferase PlsX